VRGLSQSRLDGTGYSPMEILWDARDVFVASGRVVPEFEGHLASRSLEMRPSLRMRQGLASIERLLSIFRQVGKHSVLFCLQRIFDEISHFERQRDAFSLGPTAKPFIDRLFKDNVDARIGCGHGVLYQVIRAKTCTTCDGSRQGKSAGCISRHLLFFFFHHRF
jgi:hypothetical protein